MIGPDLPYLAGTSGGLSSAAPVKRTRKSGYTSETVFLGPKFGARRFGGKRQKDMPAVEVEHILRSRFLPLDRFWGAYDRPFEQTQ